MSKRIRITNIKWDTDGENPRDLNLPKSVYTTEEEIGYDVDKGDEDGLADFVGDWLSDTYGFCHFGFRVRVLD